MKTTDTKLANSVLTKLKKALKNPPNGIPAIIPGMGCTPAQRKYVVQKSAILAVLALDKRKESLTNDEEDEFCDFVFAAVLNHLNATN